MTRTITINVTNIKVKEEGYYSFDYKFTVKGKTLTGSIDSTFSGQTARDFKKVLHGGWAFYLVMQRYFG